MSFKVKIPQIKLNEWCAALEGGAYAQGAGTLCAARADAWEEFKPLRDLIEDNEYDDDGRVPTQFQFCCLGVLADVMGVPRLEIAGQTLDDICTKWDVCPATWLGPYECDVDQESLQFVLAQMNDGHRAGCEWVRKPSSFAEIAAWIRENVEGAE